VLYITQLIYVKDGQEEVFNEFESMAIPIIGKYGGQLLLRLKPGTVVEAMIEKPYEVHIVSFPSEEDFERFKMDETRRAFLHLKEQSVKETILIKGIKI
jgi:uncharacterized protein (DUF1330 family)